MSVWSGDKTNFFFKGIEMFSYISETQGSAMCQVRPVFFKKEMFMHLLVEWVQW